MMKNTNNNSKTAQLRSSNGHRRGNPRNRQRQNTPLAPEVLEEKKRLESELDSVTLADVRSFQRRLSGARSLKALEAIAKDIKHSQDIVQKRKDALPQITYPESLPVTAKKDEIAEAIRENQVVIIAGETGSGKTTQIPKILLDLGRGTRGLIGHTQPRRLAARTVAERIASELDQPIGESVGYAIRFDDKVSASTSVKLMTDGILLAEMQRDRYLNAYDTLIIDEAHERSLNIDFILGYLKQLLPKRPDLKVIITSATIDPERFAEHFSDATGIPAPVIEVSGRTYPVEILYRPLQAEVGEKLIDIDPVDGLITALEELMSYGDGDILCFFAGEADIREAMEAIRAQKWKGVEVVPLFGRLSNEEQHRVFTPHSGRRIVLATNIAETSLTVPGIHYVVDTGTARISRYSVRNKVQRLPIEEISQASANQRSGRCGRIADGVAIRLYSEEDYLSRPEFTDPEILRTNLANVILQMAHLRLGNIDQFPFLEKPDTRSIRDGILLLQELGAFENDPGQGTSNLKLSNIGKMLARIPLDPRLGRMLIEGERLGVLGPLYVIVAALSIQDVRERPLEKQAQADQLHARFKDPHSDFLSYLKLWDYINEQRDILSGNAFKKLVKSEYLHYMRIREWWDLVRQLKNIGDQLGWTAPEANATTPDADSIHQSLLAGLLSRIGIREGTTKEFLGARGTKFMVFPGSNLAKKPPQFLMAAEILETSRVWARNVAAIDPRWVERLAGDLLKKQYSEPHWSAKRAAAMVYERATLYGVPIFTDKLTPYHKVDPSAAREMFIRNALVDGDWTTHHAFFKHNSELLDDAENLEDKARRRDILIDEEALFQFYDRKLPSSITTGANFNHWWKKTSRTNPHLLDFTPEDLVTESAEIVTEREFPDQWHAGNTTYSLTYRYEPGHPEDGVTVNVPVPLLGTIDGAGFEWLVPGMRLELVTETLRTLPKALRRTLVPIPTFAENIAPLLEPANGPLIPQISEQLKKMGVHGISERDFDLKKLPEHLKMRFAAIDKRGKIIDSDRNLDALKQRLAQHITSSVSKVSPTQSQASADTWTMDTLGTIPEETTAIVDGQKVTTYPALTIDANGIGVSAFPTKAQAQTSMLTSTLALLAQKVSLNPKNLVNGLPLQQRVALEHYPHGGITGFISDARIAALRDLLMQRGGPVRDPREFENLSADLVPRVQGVVRQYIVALAPALVTYLSVSKELSKWEGDAIEDMELQLKFLLPKNAITVHGMEHLKHLPRYLAAMNTRLSEMAQDPDKDLDLQDRINALEDQLTTKLASLSSQKNIHSQVQDIQWMLQELRVSFFDQRKGTAIKVSEKKIGKAINNLGK